MFVYQYIGEYMKSHVTSKSIVQHHIKKVSCSIRLIRVTWAVAEDFLLESGSFNISM